MGITDKISHAAERKAFETIPAGGLSQLMENRGRIFAGNGCKWRGNVIESYGSNGIRRCTQVVEGSGFEIR